MATRIIEFGGPGRFSSDYPVIPMDQKITEQTALTASGTSAQSAAFNASTGLVIIDTDEQIYVNFGTNPTAATTGLRIAAGGRAEFSVPSNASWKVAVRT